MKKTRRLFLYFVLLESMSFLFVLVDTYMLLK